MVLNKEIPDWRWFWGQDYKPDPKEAQQILKSADVLLTDPNCVLMMTYDRVNLVATVHIYLEPTHRNSRRVAETILTAEKIAATDGMRKIVAPLTEGNPYLRGGKKRKFGYTLEGELKNQFLINGQPHSLFLYGKLLQQNPPGNKKE